MKLTTLPKIRLLPAGKPLAPYLVPPPPAGKFDHCPGQLALDVFTDDPDVSLGES